MKINRGDVWMIDLDPVIGREQAKIRPCVIISANYMNQGSLQLIIVIPITSQKRNFSSHIPINPPEGGLKLTSYIMCEHTRSLSIERLKHYMGTVEESTLANVENILKKLISFY